MRSLNLFKIAIWALAVPQIVRFLQIISDHENWSILREGNSLQGVLSPALGLTITIFLGLIFIGANVLLLLEKTRPIAAAVAAISLTAFLFLHPLLVTVSDTFVGWTYLWLVFVPRLLKREDAIPGWLITIAWTVFSLGYADSAIDKIQSPAWNSGLALLTILDQSPVTAINIFTKTLKLFPHLTMGFTFAAIALELTSPVAIFIQRARPVIWWGLLLLHLGIFALLHLNQLSIPMIATHLFLLRPEFLPRRSALCEKIPKDA